VRDADQLTRWVAEHSSAIFGYLWVTLRDRAAAEDLTQQVFVRAWSARSSYVERGQARAYLLQIAQRLCVDHGRRQRREGPRINVDWGDVDRPAPAGQAADFIEREENVHQLREALELLNPAQRRVLLLRYFGEMSFEQIAATTQAPLGTVLSHCHRGLTALRRILVERDASHD
jgi:RNA polymerase sigma-70 factor (ECF subfamily)